MIDGHIDKLDQTNEEKSSTDNSQIPPVKIDIGSPSDHIDSFFGLHIEIPPPSIQHADVPHADTPHVDISHADIPHTDTDQYYPHIDI